MKTLKHAQEHKSLKIPAKTPKGHSIKKDDDLIYLFPQPRYFQVHFQHVHENTHDLQAELVQLKQYVARVDEKLERLMSLLGRLPEHVL